jgi:hypothetical protein
MHLSLSMKKDSFRRMKEIYHEICLAMKKIKRMIT